MASRSPALENRLPAGKTCPVGRNRCTFAVELNLARTSFRRPTTVIFHDLDGQRLGQLGSRP